MSQQASCLTARDMMTTRFVRIKPSMDIYEAVDLLLNHRVANAPVVDEEDRLVGFLSEKDCMRSMLEGAYDSNPCTSVERCMSTVTQTITEATDVMEIAEIFLQTAYRRLPVVRGNILVGIISRRDFLEAMAEQNREDARKINKPSDHYLSGVTENASLHTS